MIVTTDQTRLQNWLCARLGRGCTPDMRCIGRMVRGQIIGVVGLDDWDAGSVAIHVAGYGNWLTRDLLWAVFDYAFNVGGVRVIYGLIPSVNVPSTRFAQHVGFAPVYTIEDGHADGDLVLHTMRKQDCRYLNRRKRHEQNRETATAA